MLLSGTVAVVGGLVAALLLTGALSAKGSGPRNPTRQAVATTSTTTTAEVERQLISDVTMVPLNGSTVQSSTSLVAVHATGATLQSVNVEALRNGAKLPGTLNAAGDEWLSTGSLRPNTTYKVVYRVEGNGLSVTGSAHFATTAPQPLVLAEPAIPVAASPGGVTAGSTPSGGTAGGASGGTTPGSSPSSFSTPTTSGRGRAGGSPSSFSTPTTSSGRGRAREARLPRSVRPLLVRAGSSGRLAFVVQHTHDPFAGRTDAQHHTIVF